MLKISHDKFRGLKGKDKADAILETELTAHKSAVSQNKEMQSVISSALIKVLNPSEVLNLLELIPDEDVEFLLINPQHGHPMNMILTRIPGCASRLYPAFSCFRS